jgi:hypothetical protein
LESRRILSVVPFPPESVPQTPEEPRLARGSFPHGREPVPTAASRAK